MFRFLDISMTKRKFRVLKGQLQPVQHTVFHRFVLSFCPSLSGQSKTQGLCAPKKTFTPKKGGCPPQCQKNALQSYASYASLVLETGQKAGSRKRRGGLWLKICLKCAPLCGWSTFGSQDPHLHHAVTRPVLTFLSLVSHFVRQVVR